MPTQAPTGSTSRSRELTAIFERAPGLARRRLDAHDLLVDLGDLHLEQLLEQALVRARQDDLRAARGLVDVDDVGDDAVAGAVRLARHLLAHRQHGLGAAQVDDDVAALEPADDAGDELALAVLVLVEDVLALGLAHALQDDLLGGLRGDAAEALPGAVELQELAVLGVLLLGLGLILLVVEDLEQQLVADLGLEAEALRVRDGDLLALVARRSTCSTMTMIWNRSTRPVSSLNLASISRCMPKARLAAVRMACSSVSTRTAAVDVLVLRDLVEDQAEGGTITHEALRWNSCSQSGTRFALATSSMGSW